MRNADESNHQRVRNQQTERRLYRMNHDTPTGFSLKRSRTPNSSSHLFSTPSVTVFSESDSPKVPCKAIKEHFVMAYKKVNSYKLKNTRTTSRPCIPMSLDSPPRRKLTMRPRMLFKESFSTPTSMASSVYCASLLDEGVMAPMFPSVEEDDDSSTERSHRSSQTRVKVDSSFTVLPPLADVLDEGSCDAHNDHENVEDSFRFRKRLKMRRD